MGNSFIHALTLLLAAVSGLKVEIGENAPPLIAQLCRDQTCEDPQFPLIDYDDQAKSCVCSQHPCWDNNGVAHTCDKDSGYPYLFFSYTAEGELQCSCSTRRQYLSNYIAKVKCPGHSCQTDEYPL